MGGACGAYGGVERGAQGSGGETWGKEPLGRPRRRWEDNKMDLQEVGEGCGNWMELAQDRDRWRALVRTVMNLRVPKMRGISWLAAEPVSISRRTLLHGVSKCVHLYLLGLLSFRILKENTTCETSHYVILSTRVTFSEVHVFTTALVFQTYGTHIVPQKVRDQVSRPYKAPRITRFEVCSSCLLTCHLRHLTHLNAWAPLFATMNKAVDCLGIHS